PSRLERAALFNLPEGFQQFRCLDICNGPSADLWEGVRFETGENLGAVLGDKFLALAVKPFPRDGLKCGLNRMLCGTLGHLLCNTWVQVLREKRSRFFAANARVGQGRCWINT